MKFGLSIMSMFQDGKKPRSKGNDSLWDVFMSFCQEGKEANIGTQLLDYKIQYYIRESQELRDFHQIIFAPTLLSGHVLVLYNMVHCLLHTTGISNTPTIKNASKTFAEAQKVIIEVNEMFSKTHQVASREVNKRDEEGNKKCQWFIVSTMRLVYRGTLVTRLMSFYLFMQ